MGPAARDRIFLPLIARLKADEGLRQNALARLDIESAPWNARSVRSHFLRRFGVVVARGGGSALVKAKWDGRVLLRARGGFRIPRAATLRSSRPRARVGLVRFRRFSVLALRLCAFGGLVCPSLRKVYK